MMEQRRHPSTTWSSRRPCRGIDLIPSNIDFAGAEMQLINEVGREHLLARALAPALERYDIILIDCQPSLGLLTVNALAASDGVIVPLECEYFALRGVAMLKGTIDKVQERLNPRLSIIGLLGTMYDGRTLHSREVLRTLVEGWGDQVFHTVIRRTVKFSEATVAGEPLTAVREHVRPGAEAYRQLAQGGARPVPGRVNAAERPGPPRREDHHLRHRPTSCSTSSTPGWRCAGAARCRRRPRPTRPGGDPPGPRRTSRRAVTRARWCDGCARSDPDRAGGQVHRRWPSDSWRSRVPVDGLRRPSGQLRGPFDLLLQLISRHQLDISEVALSRVTDEFIAHLKALGSDWELDATTSFLVVASTLLDLKVVRLLPVGRDRGRGRPRAARGTRPALRPAHAVPRLQAGRRAHRGPDGGRVDPGAARRSRSTSGSPRCCRTC